MLWDKSVINIMNIWVKTQPGTTWDGWCRIRGVWTWWWNWGVAAQLHRALWGSACRGGYPWGVKHIYTVNSVICHGNPHKLVCLIWSRKLAMSFLTTIGGLIGVWFLPSSKTLWGEALSHVWRKQLCWVAQYLKHGGGGVLPHLFYHQWWKKY